MHKTHNQHRNGLLPSLLTDDGLVLLGILNSATIPTISTRPLFSQFLGGTDFPY